jgi:Family of unknown function (DUF6069)
LCHLMRPGRIYGSGCRAGSRRRSARREYLHFTLPFLLGFTAQIALAGWITLAVLEHDTRHALGIWTALGVSVLAVSFAPIALAGASPSSKAVLSLIHLSVAGVLLVTMRRNTAQR